MWSSSTGTTISTSQHSAAVAATWLKGFSGCRRVKFVVECRVDRRQPVRVIFEKCLVRVLRASPRRKTSLTRRSGRTFLEVLVGRIEIGFGEILYLILGGARFSILLLLRRGSGEGSCRSSRVINRDKLQHEFLLSSFLFFGTIVAPKAKRSSGSVHWSGMFSCYTSGNVCEEDWRT